MARAERRTAITPSVLDRLLDDAPVEATDPPSTLGQDLENLKRAVQRDLESLLNTRQEALTDLASYPELQNSLLTYGLPDFTSLSLQNTDDRVRMREAIEQAIARFEPRLVDVAVAIDQPDEQSQQLGFRVDAYLKVDPVPAPVTFDAVLQLATQQYRIKGQ